MALPSTLTAPLTTKAVNDPELAAQANIDLNAQTITNPGATATIDPTLGSFIVINTTTVGTTLALSASPKGTMTVGQRVTVVITSSGVSPTLAAGTNVHLTSTAPVLVANKATCVEFRYDGTELKQCAASAALS